MYNSYFTCKYDVYINVELCNSIDVVKYIYKYVYKEDNKITLRMQDNKNKIALYLNDYYIESYQAT